MENKKDKVALNDELLEKVAGGKLNFGSDDYLEPVVLDDGPEPVQVFWFGCDRCHNEFRSDVFVYVSPCCGAGCTLARITHEYI